MKPTIITEDFTGLHNRQLDQNRARLLRGGSWKKQRLVVIVPAGETISPKVAFSWWNLAFPPNQAVFKMLAMGMEVGEAYSSAIEQVLGNPDLSQWEYLLTIEHDNMPPSDGVLQLLAQMEAHPEYACIGGLYWTKGEGGVPQIWGDPSDPVLNFRPQIPRPGELQEVCGTGMGFNLWRLSLFKDERIRRPWFRTLAGKDGIGTQDLAFWSEARKYGYRCAIDCACMVGHLDLASGVVW
jgi:hypothetical protein